jgi:hypothetical protein
VSVDFNGLTLGIFSGDLAVHRVQGLEPAAPGGGGQNRCKDVAYIYKAGLKGFAIQTPSSNGATMRNCGSSTILAAI